jgi:hypothetical protein
MFNDFLNENRAVYKITWKNIVQADRSQVIIYYGARVLFAEVIEVRIDIHTQKM